MLEIGAVVWGVRDIPRSVAFWSAALHYRLKYPASDDWAVLVPEDGDGVQLSLSKVSSPRARQAPSGSVHRGPEGGGGAAAGPRGDKETVEVSGGGRLCGAGRPGREPLLRGPAVAPRRWRRKQRNEEGAP